MKQTLKLKLCSLAFGSLLALSVMAPRPVAAQASDPYIGQLTLFGFNFCPAGWTETNGQLLPIAQNTALFSLLGTTYGGDGETTFALPDLRGRAPIHVGQGPGLASYTQGQNGGQENLTVTIANMPSHNHDVQATNAQADKGGPGGKLLAAATPPGTGLPKYQAGPPTRLMHADMITDTGGGQAISKRSPYLTMRWCIALTGVYPSQN